MRYVEFGGGSGRGNGPTCPPGNNGQGNAYGHCGGGGGTSNPSSGPGSSVCTALWIYLGVTIAVSIASLVFGYAAYTVATEILPFVVVTSGIGVTGQLVDLVAAFALGDTGKVLQVLWTIFGHVAYLFVTGANFWSLLGFAARSITIWTLVIQLVLAAAFIGIGIYKLKAASCF